MSDIVRDASPESLAQANVASLADGFAACVRAYGGEVLDEPDLLWCATGLPGAGWNRVLCARLAPETVEARIQWVVERARALRISFLWMLDPSTQPEGLEEHLLRHGLQDEGEEAAMGVALAQLPEVLPVPEGVSIERVADRASLEQWARAMSAGFGAPPPVGDALVTAVSRDGFGAEAAAHYYLARLNGEPVATSALALAAGVASIFSVTTLEAARRRGIGTAITLAPLLDAREYGYHLGVLQASEMGYPVYARMGFTEQFRYRTLLWRPA